MTSDEVETYLEFMRQVNPADRGAALIRRLRDERDEARAELSACEMAFRLGERALLDARNKALDEAEVALLHALPVIPCSCSEIVKETILALKSQEPKSSMPELIINRGGAGDEF